MKCSVVVGDRQWAEDAFLALPCRLGWTWEYIGSHSALELTLDTQPRYLFFLNWSAKVPAHIVRAHECVNFHCTALPYGRGGHPIENLILLGHTSTVITAHRMTERLDDGPIYKVSEPISLRGTKQDINNRFVQPVVDLIVWIAEHQPEPVPQTGEPTYFKRLEPHVYQSFWALRAIHA